MNRIPFNEAGIKFTLAEFVEFLRSNAARQNVCSFGPNDCRASTCPLSDFLKSRHGNNFAVCNDWIAENTNTAAEIRYTKLPDWIDKFISYADTFKRDNPCTYGDLAVYAGALHEGNNNV